MRAPLSALAAWGSEGTCPEALRLLHVLLPFTRTSFWLISLSVALKKWGKVSGVIKKVTRLCSTGTVNTSPCLA